MRWLPASTSCVDGVLREDRSLDFSCSMNILAVRYDITINDPKERYFFGVAIGRNVLGWKNDLFFVLGWQVSMVHTEKNCASW